MAHRLLRLGLACLALLGALLGSSPAQAALYGSWIQIGPGGFGATPLQGTTILARAIVDAGEACPALAIDGKPAAMQVRFSNLHPPARSAQPSPNPGFAVTECEAVVPPGHRVARIGGTDLALPTPHPHRILVIGDTGCRMAGNAQQDCNDPQAFPLAFLSHLEASLRPDLVLHVGDYFYRDSDCAGAFPGCNLVGGPNFQPWGDNWVSWNADFFAPARALLQAAPWVMLRGNHESCGRGAEGWFALLEPAPFSEARVACTPGSFDAGSAKSYTPEDGPPYGGEFSPSYVVPIGRASLIAHDSSFANDLAIDTATATRYATDLRAVLAAVGPTSINVFATHRPTYGLVRGAGTNAGDFTEQYLFNTLLGSGGVPPSIGLFVAGHIHSFQYLSFADSARFAPQLIVGTGGSLLDPQIVPGLRMAFSGKSDFTVHPAPGQTVGTPVERGGVRQEFGFALLTPSTTGFDAEVFSPGASRNGHCHIRLGANFAPGTQRGIECTP